MVLSEWSRSGKDKRAALGIYCVGGIPWAFALVTTRHYIRCLVILGPCGNMTINVDARSHDTLAAASSSTVL